MAINTVERSLTVAERLRRARCNSLLADVNPAASARDFALVYRTSLLSEDTDGFADRLIDELRRVASTIGRDQEPRRLLETREYRAAVISAIEDALRPYGVRITRCPVMPALLLELIEGAKRPNT